MAVVSCLGPGHVSAQGCKDKQAKGIKKFFNISSFYFVCCTRQNDRYFEELFVDCILNIAFSAFN